MSSPADRAGLEADRSFSPAGRRATPWGARAPLRPEYRAPSAAARPGKGLHTFRSHHKPLRVMSCGAYVPRSRPGWTPGSGDCATPCPAALRRGRGVHALTLWHPRMNQSDVGVGTRLDCAQVHRLPAVLVPHGAGASTGTARRQPLVPPLRCGTLSNAGGVAAPGQRLKPLAYSTRGGEGSTPRGHDSSAPSGRHGCGAGWHIWKRVGGGCSPPRKSRCAAAYLRDRSA
jgi:hypothetical protein